MPLDRKVSIPIGEALEARVEAFRRDKIARGVATSYSKADAARALLLEGLASVEREEKRRTISVRRSRASLRRIARKAERTGGGTR
jgi:hypothetical protein